VVHRVQDAVSQSLQTDWTVERMAEVACTSARHLTRLFQCHAHISPLQYLRRLRLDRALVGLRSGLTVSQAAALAGFASEVRLRRIWKQSAQPGTPRKAKQKPPPHEPTDLHSNAAPHVRS
jgi:transcriptional regulator GlxA family with amidase domain